MDGEQEGERDGAEDPRGGGAEEMKNFFAAPSGDSAGVAGGEEILPFSEEQNAEVFLAGSEGGGPEAVTGWFVETLVGQPRE